MLDPELHATTLRLYRSWHGPPTFAGRPRATGPPVAGPAGGSDQARRRGGQRRLDGSGQGAGRLRGELHRDPGGRPLLRVEEVDVEGVLGRGVLRVVEVHGRLAQRETTGRPLPTALKVQLLGQVGAHAGL